MFLNNLKILIIYVLWVNTVYSQYHPPIQIFPPELYNAGSQNWKISQDAQHRVYVANNFGLLEFNGSDWSLHPTPNNSIMRSVFVNSTAVYTGSYMDFGYWLRQKNGTLTYRSIAKNLNFSMIEDEQVWNIIPHKQFIVFQTLDRLIIYDQVTQGISTFNPVSGILKVFVEGDNIYYQDNNLSIYNIINENGILFLSADELSNNQVIGLSNSPIGTLIVTREKGLLLKQNGVKPFNPSLSKTLAADVLYSYVKTKNGQLVLGSISNGVYILSPTGELLQHISTEDGLPNNTVLAVYVDNQNGLWLGLDNGLSYVPLSSPINFYSSEKDLIGTVYTTKIFNNMLYVGTNQGLYYKPKNLNVPLKPMVGLDGQVWSLQKINNTLVCGHDKGAFEIKGTTANPLYTGVGVWLFRELNDSQIIAGTYNGLHLFEKGVNSLRHLDRIQDFSMSSRYFEVLNANEILVSHEYKGVFKLTLSDNKEKALSVAQIPNVPTSLYSSMTSFQGDIYYFSNQGFYQYDENQNRFAKNDNISALFQQSNFTSAKMVIDREKYLWFFEQNNLIRAEKGALSSEFIINKYPLSYAIRKTNTGFENISHLSQNEYLIGTSNGFFVFDTSRIQSYAPSIMLSKLEASNKSNARQQLKFDAKVKLSADFNSISARYFIANNNIADKPLFQYKLDGYSDNWSEWTSDATATFGNLRFGTYTLNARAVVGDVMSTQTHKTTFKIFRPWYFSNTALVIYTLLMVGFFRLINLRYSKYYRSEQEKLIEENQRKLNLMALKQNEEIMRIKNEQLEDNIEQKNKELAISTMAMIKKNQFMNALLNDLEPAAANPNVSRVLRTIKRSLKNDDDWEFFEQAFDNADKDFLKRLKELHPALTNHDLKLCAYLRLNLSSKEIAPLLNISVKSVDIKRYRLRKKMALQHDQNLTEYILSL